MNEIGDFITINGLDNKLRQYTIIKELDDKFTIRMIIKPIECWKDFKVSKAKAEEEIMVYNNKEYK